jgi:hypothetical protein
MRCVLLMVLAVGPADGSCRWVLLMVLAGGSCGGSCRWFLPVVLAYGYCEGVIKELCYYLWPGSHQMVFILKILRTYEMCPAIGSCRWVIKELY